MIFHAPRIAAFVATVAAALTLTACGGGSSASMPETPDKQPPSMLETPVIQLPEESPELPLQRPLHVDQAPVVDLDGILHVGADAAPPAGALLSAGRHDEIAVSYGRVRDGVGADEIIAYLSADARQNPIEYYPDGYTPRFGAVPPTVRVAEGATPEMVSETLHAVRLINAPLPHDWQLRFSHDPGPAGILQPSNGEILVEFAEHKDWADPDKPPASEAVGLAKLWLEGVPFDDPLYPWIFEIVTGQIWVDHARVAGDFRVEVLVHEIIHTLGRGHPDPDRFPHSVMNNPASGVPKHILFPLDSEALLAIYSRIRPSALPDQIAEDLGPWEDTSVHLRGDIDLPGRDVAFGIASRNGLARPWAFGPAPRSSLADNPVLSETVTWSGRLLGFTPALEPVGGAAELVVELQTLDGQLDFTELEHWGANTAPGPAGSGTLWDDGDLQYLLNVHGNTFVQTGSDEGTITGAFFGARHEAMGGVLKRTDVTAGFGGTR